jgi:O-methyltransferase domain/Dimerisation domain
MDASTDNVSPDLIFETGFAFWKAKALLSAVELGLFTELGDASLPCEALAGRLGLHARGARDFFDALVALELLERDADGRYSNQLACARYLDRRKPTYIGGTLEHLDARLYQSWGRLTQALRTGAPQSDALASGGYAALYAETSASEAFLKGMTDGSRMPARALAARFPWHAYRSVIDVGAAQGCVPVEIACAHPHLVGGGFDLAQIEPVFTRYVREHGLSDRLRFFPGDFLRDELPKADVLIMGRVLHNWDVPTRKLLLQKAPPGVVAGRGPDRVRHRHRRCPSRSGARTAGVAQHADRDRRRIRVYRRGMHRLDAGMRFRGSSS